uniref:Flagellar FliJ protein n=1 Tax=Agrobacterium albertimagni TaxID=147266 RepID=A0A7C1NU24_9HYPH
MGPQKKSDKLKRLVAVQRHMERMAESDLGITAQRIEENARSMDTVMDAIGSLDPLHRLFAQNYADRFDRLSNTDKQLHGLQQVQEMKLMRERAKGDRLEENMKDARDHEERERDDDSIYDLIDLKFATPASSKLQE